MPHSNNHCYEFGPFRMNVGQRLLTREGDAISLPPKATDILLLLLQNAGELVEKDDLMREVWPDSFVEEGNLTQNIFTLRRALGDNRSNARFIETVTGRGYRFIAQVTVLDSEQQVSGALGKAQLGALPNLAVLPFVNATAEADLEYLADGVTDSIINKLSQISKLRVMSRVAVFRYKGREIDPKTFAEELGVDAMLLGKIISRPNGLTINVELVEAGNGWQLWGENYDCELNDILEIQDEIARQVPATLRLKLTENEERRITARYTHSSRAYQSYIEGRFHWSRYTKAGIEKAIGHFRNAIELDPNYALAYAGIVDCYLRLATNYLPPENESPTDGHAWICESTKTDSSRNEAPTNLEVADSKIKLRHEWDWKGAERELRRANELRTDYPAAHQWHAAYKFAVELLRESFGSDQHSEILVRDNVSSGHFISRATLSSNEEVQVLCAVAREQIEVGNYDAATLILRNWWKPNEWPRIHSLKSASAADLLFTAGSLAGCLASTGASLVDQKHAEALISGSIALFEHLGLKRRCAEGSIELALCYYRQGNFELTRGILLKTLSDETTNDVDLRSVGLIRLAVSERHAGHLYDSLARLDEARVSVEQSGAIVTGRYHHELATTLKDIALAEHRTDYSEAVIKQFKRALYEFEAIGHHRYAAVVENNLGFLLLGLQKFDQAKSRLLYARRLLERFGDLVRRAQVDDTLARLYLATNQLALADESAQEAVLTLEKSDEEALLAESLTTRGLVLCKVGRKWEARGVLEGAYRIAERCGDTEGAGRALLVVIEEIFDELATEEREDLALRLKHLLGKSQQASILQRLANCLKRIKQDNGLEL